MANAIGRSALVLTTNYGAMVQGLDKSYARIQSWKSQVSSLAGGGFASRLFGKTGSDVLSTAIALADVGRAAKSIGANTAGYMAIDKQLQAVGGHAGDAQILLGKLQAEIGKAALPGGSDSAFKSIGLEAEKLAALRPDEQFLKIADALSRVESDTLRAGVGAQIFGKKWVEVAPLVAQGGEAIAKKMMDMKASGQALGEADIVKLQRLKDSTKGAAGYFEGAWNKVVVAIAPVITEVGERIQAIFKRATPWIDVLVGGIQEVADLAHGAFEFILTAIEDCLNETKDWLSEIYGTEDASQLVFDVVETIATRVLDVVDAVDMVYNSFKQVWYFLQSQILKGIDAVKHSIADMIEGFAKIASYIGIDIGEEAKYWAEGVRSAEFMAEAAEREQKAREAGAKAQSALESIGGQGNRDRIREYMDRERKSDEDYKSKNKFDLPDSFAKVLGGALLAGSKEEFSARMRLETGGAATNQIPMKQLTEQQKTNSLIEKLIAKPETKLQITGETI